MGLGHTIACTTLAATLAALGGCAGRHPSAGAPLQAPTVAPETLVTATGAPLSSAAFTGDMALLTVENLIAFLTLSALEIVLGIDNIVFIAIISNALPHAVQSKARRIGLLLAMTVSRKARSRQNRSEA